MARPGKRASHQISKTTARPSATIIPQAGAPIGNPNPRKLNDASNRITCPIVRLVMTITVLIVLGKICLQMIIAVDTPAICAEITKSNSLIPSTSPRIILANLAQTVTATANMMFSIPAPRMVTIIIATRIVGNPRAASEARIIITSNHPDRNPATKPKVVPTTAPVPKATRLIKTLVRAPYMSRLNISWPNTSVPNG